MDLAPYSLQLSCCWTIEDHVSQVQELMAHQCHLYFVSIPPTSHNLQGPLLHIMENPWALLVACRAHGQLRQKYFVLQFQ